MTGPNAVSETLYTSLTDQLPSFLSSALLQCKRLPTLPAVALNILDISQGAEATLSDYANAIEYCSKRNFRNYSDCCLYYCYPSLVD